MRRWLLAATTALSLLPLLALAQTSIGPVDTRNFGSTPFTSTGGATARTLAARGADVINVLDYGTTAAGDTALTAACNAATGYTREIWMPAGVYIFSSSVTACSGKRIVIRGAGHNASVISASTTDIPIALTQTNIAQTVTITGLGFNSTSSSATTRAIDISFPSAAGPAFANVIIDDIQVYGGGASGSPYPNSYLGGVKIDGGWHASIARVTYFGPALVGGLPPSGTSAVELLNCYDTTIRKLTAITVDSAVLQSAYGEYVDMDGPSVVNGNYALNITNAIRSDKNNQTGLSYYVHEGELDVVLAGVNIPAAITNAWVHDNHIVLGRAAGGAGLILTNTNKVHVQDNTIEQAGSNVTATAVSLAGTDTNALISGNTFNTANAVTLGSSTISNTVAGNRNATNIATPIYTDSGTTNSISWIGAGGVTQIPGGTLGSMVLLGTVVASGQSAMSFTGFATIWAELEIRCTSLRGSVAGQNFTVQFGTGATPSYATTSYQTAAVLNTSVAPTPTGYGATNDAGAGNVGQGWSITSTSDLSFRGKLEQPSSGSLKVFTFDLAGRHNTNDSFISATGMSVWTAGTAAITGIRAQFSSGVFAAGQCSLYGLLN